MNTGILRFSVLGVGVLTLAGCSYWNPIAKTRHYKFPDARVSAMEMCGEKEGCTPGNTGVAWHFRKNPFSPTLEGVSTPRQIAYSLLGHAVKVDDNSGKIPLTCNDDTPNPFTDAEITPLVSALGRPFELTRSETLKLDVQAAADASLADVMAVTNDAALIAKAKAEITAAYSRLNSTEVKVIATYTEWGLTQTAVDLMTRNKRFCECKEFMKAHNYKVITAIGLVTFSITYQGKSLDVIAGELQAELEKQGITANLTLRFKREVSKSIKASTENGYQVQCWTLATLADLSLDQPAPCPPDPFKDCGFIAPTDQRIRATGPNEQGIYIFDLDCVKPELKGRRIRGTLDFTVWAESPDNGNFATKIVLGQPSGQPYLWEPSGTNDQHIHYVTNVFTVPEDGHIRFSFQVDHAWGKRDPEPLTVRAGSSFSIALEP